MPDDASAHSGSQDGPAPEPPETAWQRRKRLAAVFGDVLPETTTDERDPSEERGTSDRWLREQVPPHHG